MSNAPDIDRMRRVAEGFLHDATLLQSDLRRESDGAYLLQLTAFEILLKAVLRFSGHSPQPTHRFADLFNGLPATVRDRVLNNASARFGPHADFSQPMALLEELGKNFIALRYSYEPYQGLPAEEYDALGQGWAESGAAPMRATFRYHPMELTALTESLQRELPAMPGQSDSPEDDGAA
jgi:HEPN domain-containing protein